MTESSTETAMEESNPSVSKLFILFILVLIGAGFASFISLYIWQSGSINILEFNNDVQLNKSQRTLFRLGLMVNHIGTFLIPALVFCAIYIKVNIKEFLQLKSFRIPDVIIWGLAILFSYPLLGVLTKMAMNIKWPEWLKSGQMESLALVEQTLEMESLSELFMALILIGLLAAIGEELLFRGVIQRVFQKAWKNPHMSIIVASIIFGAFHMQIERLIPLSILGALLGYSYYFTQTLWVPTILHFLNNATQVVGVYVISQHGDMPDINQIPEVPFSTILISTTLMIICIILATRKTSNYESRP